MNNIISVIEFTTSDIKIALGYKFHKKTYILKTYASENISLDMNNLLDRNTCFDIILDFTSKIKKEFSDPDIFSNLIVLLPPVGFVVSKTSAEVITSDPSSLIVQNDYSNCIATLNLSNKMDNKTVVYNDPISFKDSFSRVYTDLPIGQKSDKLAIKFDSQYIDSYVYEYYMSILKELQMNVKLTLVSSVCASHFITSFSSINDYLQLEIDENHSLLSLIKDKRLVKSFSLDFGNKYIINSSIESNSDIEKEVLERVSLENGLDENVTIDSLDSGKKKSTISKYIKALESGYNSYLNKINTEINRLSIKENFPLVIFGKSTQVNNLDVYFQNYLKRQVFIFESKVIGARGAKFINVLGAINISSYSYISFIDKNNTSLKDLRG